MSGDGIIILLAGASVCLSFIFWIWFCYRPDTLLKSLIKTASILILAWVSYLADGPVLLTLGLAFSAAGDWFLSRHGDRAFLIGMIAFAAAHVAYIVLFLTDGQGELGTLLSGWRLGGVVILAIIGATLGRRISGHAGALKIPVALYVGVIFGMGLAALSMPTDGALIWAMIGAGLFLISDMILGSERFLPNFPDKFRLSAAFLVWSLYWSAQAAILCGFVLGDMV